MNTAIYVCMTIGILITLGRLWRGGAGNWIYDPRSLRWQTAVCLCLWTWQILWLIPFSGRWPIKLAIWLAAASVRLIVIAFIDSRYPDTERLSHEDYLEELNNYHPWWCCGKHS
jgi:hypothetical protein